MSPELKRNIWLEFTGSRVILMTSVLGLVALAVYLISGNHLQPLGPLGVGGFVFITIFWGTRNAARSVIGEIRERTWDFQRLSAVSPASMTLGKLFGATSYTWYGGLLSLLIATPGLLRMPAMDGIDVAATLALLVATALLAHAVALGSALAVARRRRADARLAVLPHQAAGLLAACVSGWVVGALGRGPFNFGERIFWYGDSYSKLEFTAVATFVLALWAIIGCWREMRLELMETNAPIVWPAFLVFLTAFLMGFGRDAGAGLAIAYMGVHVTTLIVLIVEPKNTVDLRSFGDAVRRGRLGRVMTGLPAYGWAFIAAVILAVALVNAAPDRLLGVEVTTGFAVAMLGFLARDVGVFHFFHAKPRQMRGDFASLVTLGLLYIVGGAIAGTAREPAITALVTPTFDVPAWAAILPWAEAALIWTLAIGRFRGARTEPAPMAASAG